MAESFLRMQLNLKLQQKSVSEITPVYYDKTVLLHFAHLRAREALGGREMEAVM